MQLISDRITRVYSSSLEETVKSLLQSLGKLNRPYLTAAILIMRVIIIVINDYAKFTIKGLETEQHSIFMQW